MKDNYIVIHGSYGNPYKNWLPWLKESMSKRRMSSITPAFGEPWKQDYESWKKILNAYLSIGYITESTTIIAHSLGCVFVIKFLIEHNVKIKKLITVAGFNNVIFDDNMSLYTSFYLEEEKIKNFIDLCANRICIYSDTDPYVPLNDAIKFADSIKARKVLIPGAGHFTKKDGYDKFHKLFDYLR